MGYQHNLQPVFVARQPIFDTEQNIWGYELLFRGSGSSATADIIDSHQATAQVIADGFLLGAAGNPGSRKYCINFTKKILLDGGADALPPENTVIEILEDIYPTPDILLELKRLKRSGYTLALDDFTGESGKKAFFSVTDIVKVDFLAIKSRDKIREIAANLSEYNLTLLAEKIEDKESFDFAKEVGFDLFQGFFFSRPEVIPGKKVTANQASKLQLLQELGAPNFDFSKLSSIIQTDVSLSYRLFRYINSAGFGVRNPVNTITRAVALLGQRQITQWLRILLLAELCEDICGEVVTLSVQRARFLEILAQQGALPLSSEEFFLLGLFSLLDTLLSIPMEDVLEHIPLDNTLTHSLTGVDGPFSVWLDLATIYEHGDWSSASNVLCDLGVPMPLADEAFMEAQKWASSLMEAQEE